MDLGSILRLAVDIGGGNIKGGMFTSEGNDEKSDCFYVAKYANNVYEKSVYKKVDGKKVSLIGNYKVNGCDATVKDGIITAMTVRDGAAFEVNHNKYSERWTWDMEEAIRKINYRHEFDVAVKGKISGGFSVKMEAKKEVSCSDKYIRDEKVSELPDGCNFYFQAKTKQDTVWTYSINSNFAMNISEYTYTEKTGAKNTSTGNLNLVINGVSGNYIVTNSEINGLYKWRSLNYGSSSGKVEYGPWEESYQTSILDKVGNTDNLILKAPVKISVTGKLGYSKDTADIKKIEVVLNKVAKVSAKEAENCDFPYYSDSADVAIALEANHSKTIEFANTNLNFNKANVEIKNASLSDWALDDVNRRYLYDFLKSTDEVRFVLDKLCASATIHIDASEKDDMVSFVADFNIPGKTAKIEVHNAVNYEVISDVKSFNFSKINIEATDVDIKKEDFAGDKFAMTCVGVEKDGFTTTRHYKYENGKFVLDDSKENTDKQAPSNVPTVVIETGDLASASTDINKQVASIPVGTAKNEVKGGTLQAATNEAGKRIAKFESKATGKDKVIANVTADKNTKVITASAIVGDNLYTVLFVLDHNTNKLMGRIFKGSNVKNATLEGGDNCIGYFASDDGKVLKMSVDGVAESVALN